MSRRTIATMARARGATGKAARDILVVDDDPFFLALFSKIGQRFKYNDIELAQTVGELAYCLDNYSFQIVFLDHQLLDGFSTAALKDLRQNNRFGDATVVVASGFARARLIELYGPLGVRFYLRKPVSPVELSNVFVAIRSG